MVLTLFSLVFCFFFFSWAWAHNQVAHSNNKATTFETKRIHRNIQKLGMNQKNKHGNKYKMVICSQNHSHTYTWISHFHNTATTRTPAFTRYNWTHTHRPIFSKQLKPIENNNPPSVINSRNTTSITIQQYTQNQYQPIHTKPLQTHNHKAHGHNQNPWPKFTNQGPRPNPHHTHYLHNPQSTTKPHGHDMALVQSRWERERDVSLRKGEVMEAVREKGEIGFRWGSLDDREKLERELIMERECEARSFDEREIERAAEKERGKAWPCRTKNSH